MKKLTLLSAVVLFLAIAWVGITYVVGNKAQDHYLKLLEDASQFGFVTFTSNSYERGFLQSKATTLMQVEFPAVAVTDAGGAGAQNATLSERIFQVEFEHILYHGPLPMSSGPARRFGTGPAIALVETTLTKFSPALQGFDNLLEEIPTLKDALEIAKIGLDGTVESLIEIPAFEYSQEDSKFSSNGFNAEFNYSLATGAMSGTYDMKNVDFNVSEGGSMAWHGLNGSFDLERVLPMLYVGLNKAVVGGMNMDFPSFETGELEPVAMEEIVMTSNSSFDGKMVQLEQISTFGGIVIEGEKYGPLLIDVEMKNLSAQALSDFQQQIVAVYKDADSLDADAIAGTILPTYLDLFSELLAGDPEITLRKVSLVTAKGDAEGSFSLKFTDIKLASLDDPAMMLKYIQNIDASANLLVDESLVRAIMLEKAKSGLNEQAAVARLLEQNIDLTDEQINEMAQQQYEQQLLAMLAQKYIVQEGDKLKTSITFRQGELMVNGQVVPVFNGTLDPSAGE